MKKVMIWFSGTGTTAQDMLPFLQDEVLLKSLDAAIILEGVGTQAMAKAKIAAKPFNNIFNKGFQFLFGKYIDQVKGYSPADNELSIDNFFAVINLIEQMQDDNIELVIGGHSRGAAVGMVCLLASLYQQVLLQKSGFENSYLQKISRIHLVAADPVSGKQPGDEITNDMMGLTKDIKLSQLLSEIERLVYQGKPIFHISVFAARFDARNEFAFDSRWKEFIDEQIIQTAVFSLRAKLFIGGFRHSEMVQPDQALAALYPSLAVHPQQLLRQIISNVGQAEQLQRNLREHELALMRDIEHQPVLQSRTRHSAYLKTELGSYLAFSGDSLQQVLQRVPAAIEVNKRFLHR